jgi:hypothetical protein
MCLSGRVGLIRAGDWEWRGWITESGFWEDSVYLDLDEAR